jgi:large subunit ribosomal protein L9
MDIILLDHIEKVGSKHEVVKVKDGYGRNYLIPQGLAIVANKANLARLEGMKKGVLLEQFNGFAAKMAAATLKITAKAGDSGRLFGSVTAQHIATALSEQLGIEADKRIIEMPEEVKELGTYSATIKFHPQVLAPVNFEVVAEE